MTYEERKKWLCQQCGKPQQCGYVNRNLEDKCPVIQETMEGWELGYEDAIDKACEWLEKNMQDYAYCKYEGEELTDEAKISNNLIKDLRKAMEE